MKQSYLIAIWSLALLLGVPPARAQGGAKKGPEVLGDLDVYRDSMHNLEVARQYFKLRKAYVAALQRCEEVIAANPNFSKIDEVLFLAGESSLYLAENRGRQKPSLYVIHEGAEKRTLKPEQFRDQARDYLSQLVNNHRESSFRAQAEEDLKALGGPKAKASKQ